MQTENRLLDDLAKLATSAFGSLRGAREEVEARVKDQIERILHGMDLVRREEFEIVRAMAAKARAENEALVARIAALEPKAKGKPRRAAKPATRTKATVAKAKTATTTKARTKKPARASAKPKPARDS